MLSLLKTWLLVFGTIALTLTHLSSATDMELRNARPSLVDLITADPGLPRPNPTTPYWISNPGAHRLANTQSSHLSKTADVVIIGSGITGASTAFHLLQDGPPELRVTVLEARSLCSGATGRNGGHLITYGAVMYSTLKEALGAELAYKVLNFTFQNVNAVADVVRRYASEEAGYRAVDRVRCFGDMQAMKEAMASVEEFEKDWPERRGMYTFIDPDTVREVHGIGNVAGAVVFSAGALSPYRFIMKIWETLLATYSTRLSIEANTRATKITANGNSATCTDPEYKYQVHTPRGIIRSKKIIYATNAYTGHLLPTIRGYIWPFREGMTVQDLGDRTPNRGNTTSWSVHHEPVYDEISGRTEMGTLYLQQDPTSGDFYFGGGYMNAEEALTADDSRISAQGTRYLRQKLAALLGQTSGNQSRLVSEWTGIQGFTADELPLIGPLPSSLTDREGSGEWVAAGYNGGGMAFCWMAGKAISDMVRGLNVAEWFPEVFYMTEQRLQSSLAIEAAVEGMKWYFPGYPEQ